MLSWKDDPEYRALRWTYEQHEREGLHLANPALMDGRHVKRSEELIAQMAARHAFITSSDKE